MEKNNTTTMKKIFSTNLCAFILMVTGKEPMLGKDAIGQTYFLFPDDEVHTLLINTYRNNHVSVDLKDYIAAFRRVRNLMKSYRGQ